jgi:hypothetical protein
MENENMSHDSVPADRHAMRVTLTKQFMAYHQRRRWLRRGGVAMVVIAATLGGTLVWHTTFSGRVDSKLEGSRLALGSSATSSATAETAATATGVDTRSAAFESAHRDVQTFDGQGARKAIDPAKYTSISVEVLSDEELEATLRETDSEWFVVEVEGKLQAFSGQELERSERWVRARQESFHHSARPGQGRAFDARSRATSTIDG